MLDAHASEFGRKLFWALHGYNSVIDIALALEGEAREVGVGVVVVVHNHDARTDGLLYGLG